MQSNKFTSGSLIVRALVNFDTPSFKCTLLFWMGFDTVFSVLFCINVALIGPFVNSACVIYISNWREKKKKSVHKNCVSQFSSNLCDLKSIDCRELWWIMMKMIMRLRSEKSPFAVSVCRKMIHWPISIRSKVMQTHRFRSACKLWPVFRLRYVHKSNLVYSVFFHESGEQTN